MHDENDELLKSIQIPDFPGLCQAPSSGVPNSGVAHLPMECDGDMPEEEARERGNLHCRHALVNL